MFIDYENYDTIEEDFIDVLLDFDIACEGFLGSAVNVVKKGIDFIIKMVKAFFNFIKSKLKRSSNELPAEVYDMFGNKKVVSLDDFKALKNSIKRDKIETAIKDDFDNKDFEIVGYDWNLEGVQNIIFGILNKISEMVDKIPVDNYTAAIDISASDDFIKSTTEELKSAEYMFKSEPLQRFVKDKVDTIKGERKTIFKGNVQDNFDQVSMIVLNLYVYEIMYTELMDIIDEEEYKINNKLLRVRKAITKAYNPSNPSLIDSSVEEKRELLQTMNRCVNTLARQIQVAIRDTEKLVELFGSDTNNTKRILMSHKIR